MRETQADEFLSVLLRKFLEWGHDCQRRGRSSGKLQQIKLGDTIFKDVVEDEHFFKSLSHYGLEPSLEAGQLLKNLKAARVVNLLTDEEGTVLKIIADRTIFV